MLGDALENASDYVLDAIELLRDDRVVDLLVAFPDLSDELLSPGKDIARRGLEFRLALAFLFARRAVLAVSLR